MTPALPSPPALKEPFTYIDLRDACQGSDGHHGSSSDLHAGQESQKQDLPSWLQRTKEGGVGGGCYLVSTRQVFMSCRVFKD